MMFTILLLAGASLYVEIRLGRALPWLKRVFQANALTSLGCSLGLSLLLGAVFGAAGVMVFAAGVLSTAIIQPYYAFCRRWARVRAHLPRRELMHQHLHAVRSRLPVFITQRRWTRVWHVAKRLMHR